MGVIMRAFQKFIVGIVNKLAQSSVPEVNDGRMSSSEAKALCRRAAAESCVLLKNEGVLPIENEKVAVFGRGQINWFYVGYGSGGDVKAPYRVNLMQGLENANAKIDEKLAKVYRNWCEKHPPYDGIWGMWPMCYDEMPVTDALVADAASRSDVALVVLGRSAGEDRENKSERGSWYLTKREERLLKTVTTHFKKVCVILNCGGIMDMSWVETYHVGAVLYAWQGGQESGNGVADVLLGKVNPSGKLTDTIAHFADYPSADCFGKKKFTEYREDIYVGYRYFETFAKDKVLYPFGFGLSYTKFELTSTFARNSDQITIETIVKNVGERAGREVVQLYCEPPQGKLGKPVRNLVGYRKTRLLQVGESETIAIRVDESALASFDDTGKTGNKHCFVLEEGEYRFYGGTDVRSAALVGKFVLNGTKVVAKCQSACGVKNVFERMGMGGKMETVSVETSDLRKTILSNLPKPIPYMGNKGYTLKDVKSGKVSMDDFIAQLDEDELEALTRGSNDGMNSPLGAPGNAAVFGGTTESLRKKGVPIFTTNDGPSGVRLQAHSTLIPIGVALAATFDEELIHDLLACIGKEGKERSSNVLLAPGMNVHRNPLCGRNFEYFSEDPYLTGKLASAYVKGVQDGGVSATIKHFACNNQETGRLVNDSRVSERALREIYLKPFEITVKEAKPHFVMDSYNKLNGVWNCYNYELNTVILRNEWGFEGCVMTDWWIKSDKSRDFKAVSMQAYRVRAQVDLFMPGSAKFGRGKGKSDGTLLASLHSEDGITLAEIQRSVKNVLNYMLRSMKIQESTDAAATDMTNAEIKNTIKRN